MYVFILRKYWNLVLEKMVKAKQSNNKITKFEAVLQGFKRG